MFRFSLILLTLVGAAGVRDDSISEVVSALQQMLDKSKEDSASDRTVYAKFKCFCDTTTKAKQESIQNAETDAENFMSEIENRRAKNQKLSMEVGRLEKDLTANEQGRTEATTMRGDENGAFLTAESDAETGIVQLKAAIEILSAVGADQTVSGDARSERLMAKDATEAAGGGPAFSASFLAKKNAVSALSEDMKAALRAASVFIHGDQRRALSSFLQGPQNADYESQSGEIVGIVKNMLDTFEANLKSDRATESKKQGEYDTLDSTQLGIHTQNTELRNQYKEEIGTNAEAIAVAQGDHDTAADISRTDTEFLNALTTRCANKKAEYEKRNSLRAGEDAAIAQAIALLNSDAAFATFDKGGLQTFVQVEQTHHKVVRGKVLESLLSTSRGTHSMRLARIAAVLTAGGTPFEKVVGMSENPKVPIVAEATADAAKISGCTTEQTQGADDKENQEEQMGTLKSDIGLLDIAIGVSETNIKDSKEDLATDTAAQEQLAADRAASNAVFRAELKNCQGMQQILDNAIKVLDHYYNVVLASHNKEKVYNEHTGKDSGGGNLKRMEGASNAEMEEECSKIVECAGFNSAGWLKKSIAPEEQWYDWEDGALYVKELVFLQMSSKDDPATWEDEGGMSGQTEQGTGVITMLRGIETSAKDQDEELNRVEGVAVTDFNMDNGILQESIDGLNEALTGYRLELADQQTSKRQKEDDLRGETDANTATKASLAAILPGCTFIQENVVQRGENREAETASLDSAITLLKSTPLA